jgi:hypothetical protein
MPGRRRRTVVVSLIAIAAALGAWSAAAGAATVTVGSPMSNPNLAPGTIGDSTQTQTLVNLTLGEAGAHVASPVSGTIVSWSVSANGTGSYGIRILRPAGDGQFTGGPPAFQVVTTPDAPPNAHTFQANLPIQAGDLIGLDIPVNNGVNGYTPADGSTWSAWDPALPEGSTSAPNPIFTSPGTELAFNVTVQYPDTPTNQTPKPKPKCKKKKKHKRSAESAKKKKCKKKKKH